MDYKGEAAAKLSAANFDKNDLPDITEFSFPDTDPKAKMQAFLRSAENPYLFRVGDIGVHVVFSGQTGDTLQSRIFRLLSSSI